MTIFPTLDPVSGLPTWIRADLRALPESWTKTDFRTRRPMIPASADVGAPGRPTAGRTRGRTAATLAVLAVVAVVVWWRL